MIYITTGFEEYFDLYNLKNMSNGKTNIEVSELQYVKGVGPKRAEALATAGILTPRDLLLYLPRTYVAHERVPTLAALQVKLLREKNIFESELKVGENFHNEVSVVGRVISHKEHGYGRRKKLLVLEISDGSGGRAFINFWSYADYYKKTYPLGMLLSLTGKPEIDSYNKIVFNHPDIEKLDEEDENKFKAGGILPVYPVSDKMQKAGINTRLIRKIVANVIEKHLPAIRENLPEHLIKKLRLKGLRQSIRMLHFPETVKEIDLALQRLKFNEIFYFELMLSKRRSVKKTEEQSVVINPKSERARKLYETLPFELTRDQKKVIREIMNDMESGKPMNRLLQGDVGSGKTIVALLTMLAVIDNGYQVAIMAPTELLAEQHYHSINKFAAGLDVNIVELTGGQRKKYRQEVLDEIASGKANIIVGTHAMFESSVEYNNLGYIVIDEQHRFGVDQRADLIKQGKLSLTHGKVPHILVMSATPIPRTLSLTLYGDLDVSLIRELPANRKPIKTKVVFDSDIQKVYDFIRKRINEDEQAYIVYPLVEKSDKIELKSAVEFYEKLNNEIFPDLKCGLLHGQMLWYEKEDVMKAFLEKEYQILVATTVIEVGIDVPNATVMVIEDAERFGLSQLHQMRGRVGRSDKQSYCLLVTKDKFSYELKRTDKGEMEKMAAIVRLRTMENTTDGFEIAEVDLKLRGPGDLMGTRQSGLPDFRFIDLTSDLDIITLAKNEAEELISEDPNLNKQDNKIIKYYLQFFANKDNYYDIA